MPKRATRCLDQSGPLPDCRQPAFQHEALCRVYTAGKPLHQRLRTGELQQPSSNARQHSTARQRAGQRMTIDHLPRERANLDRATFKPGRLAPAVGRLASYNFV